MSKELTYLEAIREALAEEMRRDPKVFLLGEDIGPYGGAFGATQGLYAEFGEAGRERRPSSGRPRMASIGCCLARRRSTYRWIPATSV